MKKLFRLSATFVLLGALLAGCIENEPSEGIEAMRQAKAELIRANAQWVLSAAKVEESTAALNQALAGVEQANAAFREAEAKLKEAEAAMKEAEVEYQNLLNALQEIQNKMAQDQGDVALQLKEAEMQFKLDSLNGLMEMMEAEKEAYIAKWMVKKQKFQNELAALVNEAELAQITHQENLLMFEARLEGIEAWIAGMQEQAKYATVQNYVNKIKANNDQIKILLGKRQVELSAIEALNARITVYTTVDVPAMDRQLAYDVFKAEFDKKHAGEYRDYLKALYDAQKENYVDYYAYVAEINERVTALENEIAAMTIQKAEFQAAPEYNTLLEDQTAAQTAFDDFVAKNGTPKGFTKITDIDDEDVALSTIAWTNNPSDYDEVFYDEYYNATNPKLQDKLTDAITVSIDNVDRAVFAGVVEGKYGFYYQDGTDYVRVTSLSASNAQKLLSNTVIKINEGRIFEYQGEVDANATHKALKDSRDKAIKDYKDSWTAWQDTYKKEGFVNGGGAKRKAWSTAVVTYNAKVTAEKTAKAASDAADAAYTAAEGARAAKQAEIDAVTAQAKADLETYIAALKALITGDGMATEGEWSDWLTSVKLSELLGGITFSPEQMLKLFLGSANYDKIELIVDYLVNQDAAVAALIGSAADFKAIIDGDVANGGTNPGYFKMIEIYNGFTGAEPVIACQSIYSYHAWFLLYTLFEGNNITVGNGIFSTGIYSSAPVQLMNHFLCNNNYAAMMANKGNYIAAANDAAAAKAAANGAYAKATTAKNTAKTACETAMAAWAGQATALTNLEKKMFGVDHACNWIIAETSKKPYTATTDPEVQGAAFKKADVQPKFYFYLDIYNDPILGGYEVYPSLKDGMPIYWKDGNGTSLSVHNVGLPEQINYYQCPDYTTDFELYTQAAIESATSTLVNYAYARRMMRKFYNYDVVYNRQPQYKALAEWAATTSTAITDYLAATNEANLAELKAAYAEVEAAKKAANKAVADYEKTNIASLDAQIAANTAYINRLNNILKPAITLDQNLAGTQTTTTVGKEFVKACEDYEKAVAAYEKAVALQNVWNEQQITGTFDTASKAWSFASNVVDELTEEIAESQVELQSIDVEMKALEAQQEALNASLEAALAELK